MIVRYGDHLKTQEFDTWEKELTETLRTHICESTLKVLRAAPYNSTRAEGQFPLLMRVKKELSNFTSI